ncbi:SDR family oxidoreductase [Xenorhabdus sp. XENO-1]|uniref:SDR family NAD(P)-dependent oxidoreductase n=1 Tax=Xenorhabdus bovienii TaxID=40576 RepID=UPI0020CA9586|nr:SDR family oxidoreductase [Xenorhabdus bovienii]MCP9267362.1 SDR family oxidoreductase [Xenorhabdus bovienii subsp. africana]
MNINLKGKIALVTGSTAGIGLAIAQGMHKAGASVILNGRSEERLIQAVNKFNCLDRVFTIAADVGTREGCELINKNFPDIDILVNNAGIFSPKPIFEISDDEWLNYFNINVLSGISLARSYIPRMIEKRWGRVVFISSESALQIPVEMPHYGLTKTAQVAAARGFAQAATGTGVTVNSVLPGPTESEGVERFVRELITDPTLSMEEAGKRFIETARPASLLGRLATAGEVANAVLFLASPLASAITGTALRVDGGVIQSIL